MKPKITKYEILVLVSFSALLCYLISVLYYVTDVGKNKCLMTYMYEYPQFVKINMADKLARLSRRYGLYAYSEGKYIERAKSMKFTGIPVLFVPGQGGSYKQVRSLASVTTHRTMDLQSIFHFDFFSINFNGELSALFGGTLRDQHEFIVHCIQRVLSLYPVPNRPKSVIIIGHSMGGMVARSLFLNSYFDPETVKLIITLATPHQPVILIDKYLRDFYNSVDIFWQTEKAKSNSKLKNLTLISIGGGYRDKLVRPGLTYNRLADLNVLTNAIPDVITSTDHLCILWCNNFVKTLSRALYDAVDFDSKGITQDKNHLRNIFYYHLVHCSNGKYYTPEIHQERIKFTRNSTWKEIKQNNISLIFQYGLDEDTHIIIKKPKNSWEYDGIMVEAVNIDKRDWIAECNPLLSSSRSVYCDDGNNLSQYGTVGFNKTLNRKYFRMSFADTEMFRTSLSHLVVRLPATNAETGLNVDIYNSQSRIVEIDLNFFLFYKPVTVIKETDQGALLYMLRLNNMVTMWKVYRLHLVPLQCTNEKHAAYAVFKTPWNHDSSHVIVNWEEQEVLKLILLTIPPPEPDDVPQVDLILDPSCSYTVQIEASYIDSIAVITSRYSLCLVANIAAILILTLTRQYSTIEKTRKCPSFLHALTRGAVPWLIFPFVKIATFMWDYLSLKTYLGDLDTHLLVNDTADGWLVPLILYFVSFALVYIVGLLLQLSVSLNVWICNRYSLGDLLPKLRTFVDEEVADIILRVFPASLCATILTVSWITCEGYGFIAGLVVYYVRLCQFFKKGITIAEPASQENSTDAVTNAVPVAPEESKTPNMDAFHMHTTLFLLWYLCTLTYLPHSIMWHKNFEIDFNLRELFASKLTPLAAQDTSFWLLVAYSVSAGCLWFCDVPHLSLPNYELFARSFYATACCLLLFCQVNIFRLPSYLMPVFLSMAGHQYSGVCTKNAQAQAAKEGHSKSDKKLSKKKQK